MAQTPSPSVRAEILRREEERCRAMVAGDVGALAAMLSEHLVYTHANGRLDTKQSYLELATTPNFKFESYEQTTDAMFVHDSAVVVNGISEAHVPQEGGSVVRRFRSSKVWVNEAGQWLLLLLHNCRLEG